MKKYSQLLTELPSKTVVFAYGRFNPPTIGHELLVKVVKKVAAANHADHVIYASRSQDPKKNPLSVDKKVHYLSLMFPGTKFAPATDVESTFLQAAKQLNKKYKNIIMVAGSDRAELFDLLHRYNGNLFHFDTINGVSAGARDPDSDTASGMSASKMRALASQADFVQFKRGLPSSMRELDARRMMNDVRHGMGLEVVKEGTNLNTDALREQYHRGEVFAIGDIVESRGVQYEIAKRGSNHLLLKTPDGTHVSKWLRDVTLVERAQNLESGEDEMVSEELTTKTLKSQDKIKVARIIATMLGIENAETSSNPDQLVNLALRRIRTKSLNAESIKILEKMLALATEVGIKYDETLKPSKLKEDTVAVVKRGTKANIAKDILSKDDHSKLSAIASHGTATNPPNEHVRLARIRQQNESAESGINTSTTKELHPNVVDISAYEVPYDDNMADFQISDDELDAIANSIESMEQIFDLYDDDELAIIDDETGEEIEDDEDDDHPVNEEALMEVLSRLERMKAKVRLRRTKAKRQRATKIALRRYSGTATINKRSRRLAVKLMKKRLLRGRDPSKISVGEKERVERMLSKRKKVIGRLAMRLAPRVRKIEKSRMSNTKFTAPAPTVAV